MIKGCLRLLSSVVGIMVVLIIVIILWPSSAPETLTPTPVSPWAAIVDAYIGPDVHPTDLQLAKSFSAIMELADTIVEDTEHYTPDEIHRAQVIFDTAYEAHQAIFAEDNDKLARRWKSLDTFTAILKNTGQALPTATPVPLSPTETPLAPAHATVTSVSLWSVHTPQATNTPTETATPTPVPTSTLTPSATPVPSDTPTETTTPFLIVMADSQYGPVVVTAPPGYVLPAATATDFVSLLPRPLPSDFVVLPPAVAPTATPAPAPAPVVEPSATPTAVQRFQPAIISSGCDCSGDTLNCGDFSGDDAQACYSQCKAQTGADVHGLDRDDDGLACE